MTEPFVIGEDDTHDVGDKDCRECWDGYPRPCACGGLIHAEFGDEDYDCNYWLYTKCDQCGESEQRD